MSRSLFASAILLLTLGCAGPDQASPDLQRDVNEQSSQGLGPHVKLAVADDEVVHEGVLVGRRDQLVSIEITERSPVTLTLSGAADMTVTSIFDDSTVSLVTATGHHLAGALNASGEVTVVLQPGWVHFELALAGDRAQLTSDDVGAYRFSITPITESLGDAQTDDWLELEEGDELYPPRSFSGRVPFGDVDVFRVRMGNSGIRLRQYDLENMVDPAPYCVRILDEQGIEIDGMFTPLLDETFVADVEHIYVEVIGCELAGQGATYDIEIRAAN